MEKKKVVSILKFYGLFTCLEGLCHYPILVIVLIYLQGVQLDTDSGSTKIYWTEFPTAWKIIENLENERSIFQTWKNNGILEFQNTSVEKS